MGGASSFTILQFGVGEGNFSALLLAVFLKNQVSECSDIIRILADILYLKISIAHRHSMFFFNTKLFEI